MAWKRCRPWNISLNLSLEPVDVKGRASWSLHEPCPEMLTNQHMLLESLHLRLLESSLDRSIWPLLASRLELSITRKSSFIILQGNKDSSRGLVAFSMTEMKQSLFGLQDHLYFKTTNWPSR